MSSSPWLYRHPHLYAALRAPDPALLDAVDRILERHHEGPLTSLLDFACGPGQWLVHHDRDGMRLGGNDASAEMIAATREALGPGRATLGVGDMRALALDTEPFDVALEVSGVVSEVVSFDQMPALLASLAPHVRGGGTLLMTVLADGGGEATRVPLRWRAGPVELGGTSATIDYSGESGPGDRVNVRRVVSIEHEGHREAHVDTYALAVWTRERLRAVVAPAPGWRWLAAYDEGFHEVSLDQPFAFGELLMVLRRASPGAA